MTSTAASSRLAPEDDALGNLAHAVPSVGRLPSRARRVVEHLRPCGRAWSAAATRPAGRLPPTKE